MRTIKLKRDKKVFEVIYPTGVWPNFIIEGKATKDGLEFDEDFMVPWDCILDAHHCSQVDAVTAPDQ